MRATFPAKMCGFGDPLRRSDATAGAGRACPADPGRHDRARITILYPDTQPRYASHDCIGAVRPQAESACACRFSPAATSTPRPGARTAWGRARYCGEPTGDGRNISGDACVLAGSSPVTPHLRALSRFGRAIIWEILNSLENSWKMLEGLAGTARRRILVCRWWVERPRLR